MRRIDGAHLLLPFLLIDLCPTNSMGAHKFIIGAWISCLIYLACQNGQGVDIVVICSQLPIGFYFERNSLNPLWTEFFFSSFFGT